MSNATLRPGDLVEVEIERGVYRGVGLARHGGQVVFVPRGLPGDRLRVRVTAVEKGYVRAATEERVAPGPDSRTAPCAAFPGCGGCAYQTLAYASQLSLKVEVLRESLRRAGVAWDGEIPVAGSPEQGWRTRASFHVGRGHGQVVLGLFEEGTRRVVDLAKGCPQVSPALNDVLRSLREALSERAGLAAEVEHVHLAESPDGAERVLFLEGGLTAEEASSIGGLLSSTSLTGVGAVVGPKQDRRLALCAGSPYVYSQVMGRRLRTHSRGFFQGNRYLLERLATTVGELLPPGGSLVDLYSGNGLFGLTSGQDRTDVLMVECSELSVDDARENARRHLPGRARVVKGDVEHVLAELPKGSAERVMLDPPRAGLNRRIVEAVGHRNPSVIVYVSCDPATLGRDLRAFGEMGFEPDAVRALDLFPDTFHIETVTRLVPRHRGEPL